MLDATTLTALSSSAVGLLTPLLKKAVEKGAEELGKSSASTLFDSLKQRLSRQGAKEALDDLAEQPDNPDAQGALKMQLRKALLEDSELVSFLKQWISESQTATGISQSANVSGNDNKVAQIGGSGNTVSQ
ncbi:hypothetical protein NOV72_05756 [Caballeronia novacaledonica]|uniref:Uncharacterized protein n=1 Tax=Caballeronia novacaledonica TaxID=1544861 RepID=A0A2U3IEB8_9BURK|nr:hypothetical protein [Caballeronia novacaledonica]SPB18556.1 hypothetical protein NOV72_05756 [Caballeronia novacaledonica]